MFPESAPICARLRTVVPCAVRRKKAQRMHASIDELSPCRRSPRILTSGVSLPTVSPARAADSSPGRKPWDTRDNNLRSPGRAAQSSLRMRCTAGFVGGRQIIPSPERGGTTCLGGICAALAGLGLGGRRVPGLAPWARVFRPYRGWPLRNDRSTRASRGTAYHRPRARHASSFPPSSSAPICAICGQILDAAGAFA